MGLEGMDLMMAGVVEEAEVELKTSGVVVERMREGIWAERRQGKKGHHHRHLVVGSAGTKTDLLMSRRGDAADGSNVSLHTACFQT